MRHPKGAVLFRLKGRRHNLKAGALLEFSGYSVFSTNAIRVSSVDHPKSLVMDSEGVRWTIVRKEKLVPVTPLAHQVWEGLDWSESP